jgi:predicted lipoprotein with Yx(FWY)xxD motif
LSACSPAGGNIPITGPTSTPAPLPTSTPEPTLAPAAGEPASVAVSENEEYGQFLVDGQGMTLYLFTKDEPGKSNCSGECLANWPPLLTSGDPVAAEGVDASLLGAADLADGSQIVTYNGHPLYYWIGDKQPGDTTGQNVGEVWFVVPVQPE